MIVVYPIFGMAAAIPLPFLNISLNVPVGVLFLIYSGVGALTTASWAASIHSMYLAVRSLLFAPGDHQLRIAVQLPHVSTHSEVVRETPPLEPRCQIDTIFVSAQMV